jgi:hypothetical protein
MRPILPADLDAAARVLMLWPVAERRVVMDAMLEETEAADRVRMTTGRNPVTGGDGSLIAAALGRHRAAACVADEDYRACLMVVLERIAARAETIARCDESHHAYMGGAAARTALG